MKAIKAKDIWCLKGSNFSGVTVDRFGNTTYFICGKYSRINKPAIIYKKTACTVRRDATNYSWFYKGEYYGGDNDFTNKSWRKKVKELKRKEILSVFI